MVEMGRIRRPRKALVEGFGQLATSTLANALDDLGFDGVMPNLRPVARGTRFAGPAFTVKEVTGVLGSYPPADFRLGEVIDGARPGDVIVIDNAGHQVSTWGGLASFTAKTRGVAGLVVDGGVRDADEIEEFGFPVLSRHVVPTSGKGRLKILAINREVRMDGVRVRPGDIVVGDGTGVICVPRELAEEAQALAARFDAQDREAIAEIRDHGLSFTEALRKFAKI